MTELATQTPSLEDAIRQMINLGENDPITIARKCADLHGGTWVAEQLAAHWEEILAEIARQQIGNERRAAIVSVGGLRARKGRSIAKRNVLLATMFIPSKGYIALGDATVADLEEAASYRQRMADGLVRWATYYGDLADRLKAQGVDKVSRLKGELPPLPQERTELGEAAS